MDLLYKEYERLERKIRMNSAGTDGRGRRYGVLAKEHLFTLCYEAELGLAPSKDTNRDQWVEFGEFLDWGKRWNVLKKRFGTVSIFALLLRSSISNVFIEKTLSQTRVGQ
jgi:hypothetical protein